MFGKKAARISLCSLAAAAMLLAAGRPAKADDFDIFAGKPTATAFLHIAMADKMTSPSGGQISRTEFEIFKNTHQQLIVNRMILRAALKMPGIGELAIVKNEKDPIDWLSRNLQVTFPAKAEIMQVSLSGGNRKELAMLVNAVVDAYMAEVVDAERKKLDNRIGELKGIQAGKAQEVKDSLNDLRKMAQSLGISDSETLTLKQKNILDELQLFRTESIRSQFDLNRMNVKLASQKAILEIVKNAPISDIECELFAASDFVLKKLQEEIYNREIAADAKDQARMDSLKKKYAERIEQIREEIKHKSLADVEKEIKKLEAAIDVATKQLQVIQEDVRHLRKEADGFGMSSIDMQMRRAANAITQKSLDNITAELEKLQVESHSSPRITVLEKAEVPE